jgi:hypothetical protein
MVWFAATGDCIMANMLFWLGAEPRLNPETAPSGRCANCAMSPVCVSNPRAGRRDIDARCSSLTHYGKLFISRYTDSWCNSRATPDSGRRLLSSYR